MHTLGMRHVPLTTTLTQVYSVLSALRERRKSFVFTDGSTVSLDPRVGFFITMCVWGSHAGMRGRVAHQPTTLR